MYRPQYTHLGYETTRGHDLSVLYATEQEAWLSPDQLAHYVVVQGRPDLVYGPRERREDLVRWTDQAEDRLYVSEAYCDKHFRELSDTEARELSIPLFSERTSVLEPTEIVRPLRMMDIFSGAGGLEAAGSTIACWAVERTSDAATAFSLNHPQAKVYTEDCSNLLERIMAGTDGLAKGEVEMIVGGPPCQGYSQLNKHRHSQASLVKNSCVASFLSYCDFYPPLTCSWRTWPRSPPTRRGWC